MTVAENLKTETGSIFSSKAEALVNPVNCVGVMGKGLALEFKEKFPNNYVNYRWLCMNGHMVIGRMSSYLTHVDNDVEKELFIINFPTKKHFKDKSELDYIVKGLDDLVKVVELMEISSIALPMLGCGLGGLQEKDVIPLIEQFAESIPDVRVELWLGGERKT